MTNIEFVNKAIEIAMAYKTRYAKGMYGHVLTESSIKDLSEDYSKWYQDKNPTSNKTNKDHLKEYADKDYFGFDCICLVKGILWGWQGDLNHYRGGAQPLSNGVPDETESEYIDNICTHVVENDFSNLIPGEFLWKPGHCGIYIGNGLAVDSTNTPPQDGVAITAVANMGSKAGYVSRSWTKHGQLPYVDYDSKTIGDSQLQIDKLSYCSGERIDVKIGSLDSTYTSPWIGLYRYGIGSSFNGNSLGMWKNVTQNSSAYLTANKVDVDKNISYALPDGTYKIVLFKNQGYTKGTEVSFQIKGAKVCRAGYANGWVDIAINGYLMEGAWVGIYPKEQTVFNSEKKSLKWLYIPKDLLNKKSCQKNYFHKIRIPFSAGSASAYKVVLFSDSGYQKASEHNLNSVVIHPDETIDKIADNASGEKLRITSGASYCGQNIDINFYGITNKNAWAGLYQYRADGNYSKCTTGMWCYTATGQQWGINSSENVVRNGTIRLRANVLDVNTGTLRYLEPGTYQVVLFNNSGYTVYAKSNTFVISKPEITCVSQSLANGKYTFRYRGAPNYNSWIGLYGYTTNDYKNNPSIGWSRVGYELGGSVTISAALMPSQRYKAVLFVNSDDEKNGGETYRAVAQCEFLASYN